MSDDVPCVRRGCPREPAASGGFTLLELLAVIVVLGIAGALVIPSMSETGVLKVQGAIRAVVADITVAQSEAVAYQERRAVVFDVPNSRYRLVAVPGDRIEPATNTLYDPSSPSGLYIVDLGGDRFGNTRLLSATFDGSNALVFDSMGGPVADAASNSPGSGGTIVVEGADQRFEVTIEAFTGRVTVRRVTPN